MDLIGEEGGEIGKWRALSQVNEGGNIIAKSSHTGKKLQNHGIGLKKKISGGLEDKSNCGKNVP